MGPLFVFLFWGKSTSETESLWCFCTDTTFHFWVVLHSDTIPSIFHNTSLTQLSFQQWKYAFLLLVRQKLISTVKLQLSV